MIKQPQSQEFTLLLQLRDSLYSQAQQLKLLHESTSQIGTIVEERIKELTPSI